MAAKCIPVVVSDNFVLPFAGPDGGPQSTYPEVAYWPFRGDRGWSDAAAADDAETCGAAGWVAFLSRPAGGRRALADEDAVVAAVDAALGALGYSLRVVAARPRLASWYASAAGVIGVHGGALANVHALRPGAKVVEVIDSEAAPTALEPRWSFASLAFALGLDYRAYAPLYWPGYGRESGGDDRGGAVVVNITAFAAFLGEVFSEECE